MVWVEDSRRERADACRLLVVDAAGAEVAAVVIAC